MAWQRANLPVGVRVEELKGQERAYHVELRGKFLPLFDPDLRVGGPLRLPGALPRYAVTVLGVRGRLAWWWRWGWLGRRWRALPGSVVLGCVQVNKIPFAMERILLARHGRGAVLAVPSPLVDEVHGMEGPPQLKLWGGGVRSEERGVRSQFQTHPGVQTLTLYVVGLRSITSSEARLSQSK